VQKQSVVQVICYETRQSASYDGHHMQTSDVYHYILSVYSYDVTPGDGTTSAAPAECNTNITTLLVVNGPLCI